MSELRDLYQEVILDHHKKPRNFRRPDGGYCHVDGYNPLCGDRITVFVKVEDGKIQDISFQGAGCAISTASASMMTESLKGKTLAEAEEVFQGFHQMLTGRDEPEDTEERLGKLAVFSGVREFPVRVKCATLAWHTLHAALEGKDDPVSTE